MRITDQVPDVRVVLDHLPGLIPAANEQATYDQLLAELGNRPKIFCKLSSVVRRINGDVSFDVANYPRPLESTRRGFRRGSRLSTAAIGRTATALPRRTRSWPSSSSTWLANPLPSRKSTSGATPSPPIGGFAVRRISRRLEDRERYEMYRISNGRAPALTAVGITFAALLVGVTAGRAWQAGPDSLAREVFQRNCSGCHGADGRGGERAPSLVSNRTTRGRDEMYLRNVIGTWNPRRHAFICGLARRAHRGIGSLAPDRERHSGGRAPLR